MDDKIKILEKELENIRGRLTQKLYDQMQESHELRQTIDDLNRIIDEYKNEINTLREAFELLLADWVEELEKRGVSQEEILAQRKTFDKIMYWKQGEKFNE